MECVNQRIFNVKATTPLKIFPIGDIQLGAESVNEKYLRHIVNTIKNDEMAYWIAMGDMCDLITKNDPRFDDRELAHWIEYRNDDIIAQQLERLFYFLDPIAHKCLAIVKGNHEYSIEKHHDRYPYADIIKRFQKAKDNPSTKKLGVGYSGWLALYLHRDNEKRKGASKMYKIRLHHGYGGGRKKGGKVNKLEDFLWQNNCDIGLMGHNHEAGLPVRIKVWDINSKGKPFFRKRIGAYTGTFMESEGDGYDTYGERSGYPSIPTGGVKLILNPHSESKYNDEIQVITGI